MPALRSTPLALACLLGLAAFTSTGAARADAFFDQVAVANAAEIQAAQNALAKTSFDDTRTFAQRLIDDHTALGQQLTALAAQQHIDLPDQATLDARVAKLQSAPAKGMSFDAGYADAQVKAHEDAVKLFENEVQAATTPEIKAFAEQNAPMMQHHLQMAKRLAKTHRK
ncbi:DUF4142 domain-containing protein [Pseudomonas sp. HR96]|uniref:DUF4142 domain-containing protein n=1 Tax=Pseudomonas sp. HR96 TaxID=1027966 RepID=UPI002A75BE18|nr:DUF4142 domain-containing protein [Pseudomonas sp. HR96]WPO97770.1 DUF4142 domain-containing protein [Pseudomonas sp. HR96]